MPESPEQASPDGRRRPLLRRILAQVLGRRVMGGPFRGMQLDPGVESGTLMPRVLGTYEMELWPALRDLLSLADRPVILNVGAADGYYTIGLLHSKLAGCVVAYEKLPKLRDAIVRMAKRNGVQDHVVVRGECTPAELGAALREFTPDLLLLDVEGDEADLLVPDRVPELRTLHVVVELHPWVAPEQRSAILSAFSSTHVLSFVQARAPRADDIGNPFFRKVAGLSSQLEVRLVGERSAPTSWCCMQRVGPT